MITRNINLSTPLNTITNTLHRVADMDAFIKTMDVVFAEQQYTVIKQQYSNFPAPRVRTHTLVRLGIRPTTLRHAHSA